ncbi:MAG: DUF4236 domain-containing protein [Alphaproteobacteria bacterium]|nr:DUF4236 domain-containing protein [Alphaproteobacteria bacterium]MBL7096905.1 DUF4236 domain-containing protein [Alphaproteobacteria bacterium]
MGFRFQRKIPIFPGVHISIGKSGVSTSVGTRGADVNIGRHGVTTNAGLPGTGLSYRQRLGRPGSWFGIGLLVAALAFSVYRYGDKFMGYFTHPGRTTVVTHHERSTTHAARGSASADALIAAAEPASGVRYVRRANSDLRARPSTSSSAIAHEAKGAKVTLLAVAGKWCKVNDGAQEGWMRSSVLGETPPKTD